MIIIVSNDSIKKIWTLVYDCLASRWLRAFFFFFCSLFDPSTNRNRFGNNRNNKFEPTHTHTHKRIKDFSFVSLLNIYWFEILSNITLTCSFTILRNRFWIVFQSIKHKCFDCFFLCYWGVRCSAFDGLTQRLFRFWLKRCRPKSSLRLFL